MGATSPLRPAAAQARSDADGSESPARTALRARAAEASAGILERLSDPMATMAATRIPAAASDDGVGEQVWAELTLGSGSPGLALALYGSHSRVEGQAARAHAYLGLGTRAAASGSIVPSGVFKGPGALAFAVLAGHRATGGYVSALRNLDAYQRDLVRTVLPPVDDAPLATIGTYEVVRGLTGVGRYLLARVEECGEALESVLGYLIRLARGTVEHRGHQVPRWWALDAPRVGAEASMPGGHLNLGISHGVAGPLALLALAWRQGVRVPGQQEAAEEIAALLTHWTVRDEHGPYWPGYLGFDQWRAGPEAYTEPAGWPSWCYGAPGVSRALQLAGLAFGRGDLTSLAGESADRLAALPLEDWGTHDHALCHGWAGVLHQLGRMNEEFGHRALDRVRDRVAAVLVDAYDPDLPFGHRFTMTRAEYGSDVSGYLDGAAGVALALDAYAAQGVAQDWDMPLLLA